LSNGLIDHLERRCNNEEIDIGKIIIMPSSSTRGDRHMQEFYQDAMIMVRKFGKPTFFITFIMMFYPLVWSPAYPLFLKAA
jgi:hypothetical protein